MVDDLFDIGGEQDSDGNATVVLRVHVQPAAGRSAVVGRHGSSLKVRVAAAPEGGRANDATRALLAETFGLAPGSVELTSGPASRMKRFRLEAVPLDDFRRRLERAVGASAGTLRPPRRSPH